MKKWINCMYYAIVFLQFGGHQNRIIDNKSNQYRKYNVSHPFYRRLLTVAEKQTQQQKIIKLKNN